VTAPEQRLTDARTAVMLARSRYDAAQRELGRRTRQRQLLAILDGLLPQLERILGTGEQL
jgi:anionic cell wall polymer biosynthesis LytR-Cps2A-Psr (LCP) family protein